MKCVKMKQTGAINRVPDTEAAAMVAEGRAEYCSKKAWKIATGRWATELKEIPKVADKVATKAKEKKARTKPRQERKLSAKQQAKREKV